MSFVEALILKIEIRNESKLITFETFLNEISKNKTLIELVIVITYWLEIGSCRLFIDYLSFITYEEDCCRIFVEYLKNLLKLVDKERSKELNKE